MDFLKIFNYFKACTCKNTYIHIIYKFPKDNLGQTTWDKLKCYYDHIWQHVCNWRETFWKHINEAVKNLVLNFLKGYNWGLTKVYLEVNHKLTTNSNHNYLEVDHNWVSFWKLELELTLEFVFEQLDL